MSALVEQISEVLRAHQPHPNGVGYWICECGHALPGPASHAAHVAERIAAEIQSEQDRQLTTAWQAGFNEGMKRR